MKKEWNFAVLWGIVVDIVVIERQKHRETSFQVIRDWIFQIFVLDIIARYPYISDSEGDKEISIAPFPIASERLSALRGIE